MNLKQYLYLGGALLAMALVFAATEYRVTVNDAANEYIIREAASKGLAPAEEISSLITNAIEEQTTAAPHGRIIEMNTRVQKCLRDERCITDLDRWMTEQGR